MLSEEGGYTASQNEALKRWPTTGQTNWVSIDPPRAWDMVRHEDDARGWDQVASLRRLAGLLSAHADKLTKQRDTLARIWSAEHSPAAAVALDRIGRLVEGMRLESEAALQNALALDGIMTATAKAKREIYQVVKTWETTTHDGGPEWWDQEAARLSYVTEQTMRATERAIRDHRGQISMPIDSRTVDKGDGLVGFPESDEKPSGSRTNSRPGLTGPIPTPPPLPGYPPLVTPLPDEDGPSLQGIAPPVPATPGQPVSMLPIAPGSPYAPYGGAYILPGPGVGKNGYVVALPQPGSGAGATIATQARGGVSGTPGMMPMPMSGPLGQPNGRGGDSPYRRQADTRWDVTHGVTPVILPDGGPQPESPTSEQIEEDFRQWFTQSAMPWRNEDRPDEPAPVVTIRRGVHAP
jgi:hypothetical protein